MISVTLVETDEYEVVVEGAAETAHRVHMSQAYYRSLCGATVTHEFVLMTAFRLLLAQQTNATLAPRFALADVAAAMPGFEAALRDALDR